jgi:nucleoid-associated protein YgaU
MAVFDPKSRYVKPPLEVYSAVDRRGREVKALPMIEPPVERSIGEYVKKQGEHLDHLANSFLADPNAYWRIAEVNRVLLPDALEEAERVQIPALTR